MHKADPYLPCDNSARLQANGLMTAARHAALAVTDPQTNTPNISRIALARAKDGHILTLISRLSAHTAALLAQPACAFMVGDPGPKGDPLTHPRLMIQAHADFILRNDPHHTGLRDDWLLTHPKAKLYVDFADFGFVRLTPISAILNSGFGKAYRLQRSDLLP